MAEDLQRKTALVDGVVGVQKLTKKPPWVKTVKDLGSRVYDRLMNIANGYDEVIFDTYKADSLKGVKREAGEGSSPIQN